MIKKITTTFFICLGSFIASKAFAMPSSFAAEMVFSMGFCLATLPFAIVGVR